jgi:hypothetical protein
MPFTLAHAAAAIPFRRLHLVTSALLIGTFAPDFEYFLRLAPDRRFAHTILGTFVFTVPTALLVLWIFHGFVKRPAITLLPSALRARLSSYLGEFRFGGPARFALIVASVLLGVATHLFWDSFTHPNTWAYWRWEWLRQAMHLPALGMAPHYKVLQHLSTLVGTAIVAIWLIYWYRASKPSCEPLVESPTRPQRGRIIATVTAIALAGAIIRALIGTQFLTTRLAYSKFGGEAVTAFIALVWWQLVIYGLVVSRPAATARGGEPPDPI